MKKNRGFTLVELIVVLVILAILAAVLVPTLLGYIDKAKEKKYVINAKTALDAAQAELVKEYAKNSSSLELGKPIISGNMVTDVNSFNDGTIYRKESINTKNEDYDARKSAFAKEILKTIDKEDDPPFCFFIGVGSNCSSNSGYNNKVTDKDKYTVYYAFYMESKDATPYYYYNNAWTKKNPRWEGSNTSNEIINQYNVVTSGSLKGKRLQYYLISETEEAEKYFGGSFAKNDDKMWQKLKKMKDE